MSQQDEAKIRLMNLGSNALAIIALALGIPMLIGMLDLSSFVLVPILGGAVALKVMAGKMQQNDKPD